ncbi:hypothetical protein C789_1571 [Microcystis aeruginosa FACHB-905 = DIANCHI905]|nr:hypothetical protein C789_1571 [Microcystis aeruginosa FACHB-905 = DIANCHI905]
MERLGFKGISTHSFRRFQSLIGFKINWNGVAIDLAVPLMVFQSLIGFKINWNSIHRKRGKS